MKIAEFIPYNYKLGEARTTKQFQIFDVNNNKVGFINQYSHNRFTCYTKDNMITFNNFRDTHRYLNNLIPDGTIV